MKRTQAAVLEQLNELLKIRELTIPDLKPGPVLAEVAYNSVCHSQLLEVGAGVTKVKPGSRAVLSWIKGTGANVPSTAYQSSGGPVNSGVISTFMRQTVTCENRVAPIPDAMPLCEAVLSACAIPTGAGVIFNTARVRTGSSGAVFGVGGIGLSTVLAADLVHATTIIDVDVFDHKLEQAHQVSATHLINAHQQDALATILEITGGGRCGLCH